MYTYNPEFLSHGKKKIYLPMPTPAVKPDSSKDRHPSMVVGVNQITRFIRYYMKQTQGLLSTICA